MADTTIGVNLGDQFSQRLMPGTHPRVMVKIGADEAVALFFDSPAQLEAFAETLLEGGRDLRMAIVAENERRASETGFLDSDNTSQWLRERAARKEFERKAEEMRAQESAEDVA